ncbi:MAG TPA: septal ring lytic transglycosylase RlpA family protein [Bacteroidetes bacterium]|nr:septal ring lytic transglycosylase RlpA family protein [Bacteroidota bacterium]
MKSIIKILFLNLVFTATLFSQDEEFGIASYYSDLFQGKPTASGELYNKSKLTAAHKTLPFGTLVKVTRLDNNASVQVRVNDRGPFISGRIIELSKEAAGRIDLIQDGATRVKVEVIKEKPAPAALADASGDKKDATKPYDKADKKIEKKADKKTAVKSAPKKEALAAADKTARKINKKPGKETTTAKGAAAKKIAVSKSVLVKSQDYTTLGLYEIALKRPEKKGFGVQVAALGNQDALFRKIADLQGDWFTNILVNIEKGDKNEMLYKIILGTFETRKEAEVYKDNLKKKKKIKGFVVDLAALNAN